MGRRDGIDVSRYQHPPYTATPVDWAAVAAAGRRQGPHRRGPLVSRPVLLDLFCGAGGAAVGYHRAGFDVVGVDIAPQPHYPFTFHQADALTYPLAGFDAVHASPPCQAFTTMSAKHRGGGGLADTRTDMLTPTLDRFRALRVPWVVENVVGARRLMPDALRLHGGMFGLRVARPRLFASNVLLLQPVAPGPRDPPGVYGKAPDGRVLWYRSDGAPRPQRAAVSLADAQDAMGMDWADWQGVKEAVPPAYTEWIGWQLLAAVERTRV